MRRWWCGLSVLLVLAPGLAVATVVGGAVTGGYSFDNGGTFVKLSVPFTESNPDNSVGNNTFQTLDLYAFDEGQNITITEDLAVDQLRDPATGVLGVGVLPAGTVVTLPNFRDFPVEALSALP